MSSSPSTDLDIPDVVDIRSGEVFAISSGTITLGSGGQSIGRVGINSGKINVTSGLIGVTSGRVSILSGEVHIMSGQVIAKTSGEAQYTPTQGKSNPLLVIGSISGGVRLTSGACLTVMVSSLPKNSGDIYIGYSTSGQMPYSGYGFALEPGAGTAIDIINQGLVKGYAQVSGDKLTYTSVV